MKKFHFLFAIIKYFNIVICDFMTAYSEKKVPSKKTTNGDKGNYVKKQPNVETGKSVDLGKTDEVKNGKVFYIEAEVKRKKDASEAKRKNEYEKIDKKFEVIENKDKKYIEALKEELLRKYKIEQDRCNKKIENLKKKAIYKVEEQLKKEEIQIENTCRQEVLRVINVLADKITWYQTAILLYKSCPEIFDMAGNDKNKKF